MSNNLDTSGYIIKRLRDKGFLTLRLFSKFSEDDHRKWSILVSPNKESVVITCYKDYMGYDIIFEINDGGFKWPTNFYLKTQSVNVLINQLLEKNISLVDINSSFFKEKNGTLASNW